MNHPMTKIQHETNEVHRRFHILQNLTAMAMYSQQPRSIAIVGGGVAGLQALRALQNLPQLEKIASCPSQRGPAKE